MDCRWVTYGLMGGNKLKEFDIAKMMQKRIQWIFSTLRNRTDNYKNDLIKDFSGNIMPLFKTGEFKPIVDKIFAVEDINEAHLRMEENKNIGKILVKWEKIL